MFNYCEMISYGKNNMYHKYYKSEVTSYYHGTTISENKYLQIM